MAVRKTTIRAVIDETLKKEAEAVLRARGLSTSTYIRRSFAQLVEGGNQILKTPAKTALAGNTAHKESNYWNKQLKKIFGADYRPLTEKEKKDFFDDLSGGI